MCLKWAIGVLVIVEQYLYSNKIFPFCHTVIIASRPRVDKKFRGDTTCRTDLKIFHAICHDQQQTLRGGGFGVGKNCLEAVCVCLLLEQTAFAQPFPSSFLHVLNYLYLDFLYFALPVPLRLGVWKNSYVGLSSLAWLLNAPQMSTL